MTNEETAKSDSGEISLNLIMERSWQGRRTPIFFAAIAAVVMFIILPFKTPQYAVSMTIVPAPSEQVGQTSGGSTLASLLSFAGGGAGGNSYYLRYQKLLTSTVVAQRMQDKYGVLTEVFAKEWNKQEKKWVEPASLHSLLFGWLLRWSNIPAWSAPDATTLSAFLEDKFLIVPSSENDIVVISMNSSNPAFAKRMMLLAHEQANAVLRDQVARRASQQVAYLQNKLATVTVADYRAALLTILSSQEKTLMLTQTETPFAADIVSPPIASPTPISPRPILYIVLAILMGGLLGTIIVIFFGPDWWRRLMRLSVHRAAVRRGNTAQPQQKNQAR